MQRPYFPIHVVGFGAVRIVARVLAPFDLHHMRARMLTALDLRHHLPAGHVLARPPAKADGPA